LIHFGAEHSKKEILLQKIFFNFPQLGVVTLVSTGFSVGLQNSTEIKIFYFFKKGEKTRRIFRKKFVFPVQKINKQFRNFFLKKFKLIKKNQRIYVSTKFELKGMTISLLKYFESLLIVNSFEKIPNHKKNL